MYKLTIRKMVKEIETTKQVWTEAPPQVEETKRPRIRQKKESVRAKIAILKDGRPGVRV